MLAHGEEACATARHNRVCVGAAFWARRAYEHQVTRWGGSEPAARAPSESAPCCEDEDALTVLDWLELDLKKPAPLAIV
jgi:hypothetical protein